MKFEYVKPELEELELLLEGPSFCANTAVDKGDDNTEGDNWD